MSSNVDWNNVRTGKDGQLFVQYGEFSSQSLGECDEFTIQVNNTNTDWQPVGSSLSYAIPTGHSITLTLTETVIRDDILLQRFIKEMELGKTVRFSFTGKINAGGTSKITRIVCKDCIPDGTVDLMSIKPGEVVKRAWSFRCNMDPTWDQSTEEEKSE